MKLSFNVALDANLANQASVKWCVQVLPKYIVIPLQLSARAVWLCG